MICALHSGCICVVAPCPHNGANAVQEGILLYGIDGVWNPWNGILWADPIEHVSSMLLTVKVISILLLHKLNPLVMVLHNLCTAYTVLDD